MSRISWLGCEPVEDGVVGHDEASDLLQENDANDADDSMTLMFLVVFLFHCIRFSGFNSFQFSIRRIIDHGVNNCIPVAYLSSTLSTSTFATTNTWCVRTVYDTAYQN